MLAYRVVLGILRLFLYFLAGTVKIAESIEGHFIFGLSKTNSKEKNQLHSFIVNVSILHIALSLQKFLKLEKVIFFLPRKGTL